MKLSRSKSRLSNSLVAALFGFALFSNGCRREELLFPVPMPASGYRIEGTVTDRAGSPVAGADIYVRYQMQISDSQPPAPESYTLSTPGDSVTVTVFDRGGTTVRVLETGWKAAGTYQLNWDGRLASGSFANSGLYEIVVSYNSNLIARRKVLMTGSFVTRTNANGTYAVTDYYLPVGAEPVSEYDYLFGRFYGSYVVTSSVTLTFVDDPYSVSRTVRVENNSVVVLDVILR